MGKGYVLFHPDISAPSGETKTFIEGLMHQWRGGSNHGGEEMLALLELLGDGELLPNISYCHREGGPVDRLAHEFSTFFSSSNYGDSAFMQRYLDEKSIGEIQFYVTCVGSATGALYLSLIDADVSGGEVITTSLNYVGVLNAIIMAGAKPVFVDIEGGSWCMDPDSLKKAITKDTKAIVLTHVNRLVDLEPFYDLYSDKGLEIPLIQDASLSIGSTCHGVPPGMLNLGNKGVTVFSLATSKVITGLGGAVIASNDASQLERLVMMAYQGISLNEGGVLDSFGANFKMNDMNAVIALEQLKTRKTIFDRRRMLKDIYDDELKPLIDAGKVRLQNVGDEAVVTHYGIELPGRNEISRKLYDKYSIALGMWHVHHLEKLYKDRFGKPRHPLRRSEAISDKITFLPFHTRLSKKDVKFIVRSMAEEIKS